MSDPAIVPLEFTRGNDEEIVFDFEDDDFGEVDVTGDEFVFRAVDSANNEVWRKSTADESGECEILNGTSLYILITRTETRNATARKITYTVEHRAGTPELQKSIFKGPVTMITDANDDV